MIYIKINMYKKEDWTRFNNPKGYFFEKNPQQIHNIW